MSSFRITKVEACLGRVRVVPRSSTLAVMPDATTVVVHGRPPVRNAPSRGLHRFAMFAVLVLAIVPSLTEPAAAQQQLSAATVNQAIDRGLEAILPLVKNYSEMPEKAYPMGYLSLTLAAALKSGAPTDHPVVEDALGVLEEMPLKKTYSVACYLFVLDSLWQARYREATRPTAAKGRTAVRKRFPRIPPEGPLRNRMKECIDWLVRGRGGMWNYPGRGGGDLSNTQFAVLGLEIGVQNQIPIPSEVFRSIIERLRRGFSPVPTRAPVTVTIIRRTAAWEGITAGRLGSEKYRTLPGGWGYKANGDAPTKNMTAAGVSSLLIARRALLERRQLTQKLADDSLNLIRSGICWMALHMKSYWSNDFYGLYSLEKVGDIGNIERFADADWYQLGASHILKKQKPDGSWGSPKDTALALLFLTRATRSPLQVIGPPVLTTGEKEASPERADLVYIEKLGGYVSFGALLDFFAETRDAQVVPVMRQAVASSPPHRLAIVARRLLDLWADFKDPVTRYVREELARLTGVRGAKREDAVRMVETLEYLETAAPHDPARLSKILLESKSSAVRSRALDVVAREGALQAFDAVIPLLDGRDRELRPRAERVLKEWSDRDRVPVGSASEVRADWERWWKRNAPRVLTRRHVDQLLTRLDRPLSSDERNSVVEEIIAVGRGAVPYLVEQLERADFSIGVVDALERITEQSWGYDASAWRRWWATQ